MAQNITLLGASYPDVPAVNLPKTGGGTALFADPSGVTAEAADVKSGKTFLDADGVLRAGTASGGSSYTLIAEQDVTTSTTKTSGTSVAQITCSPSAWEHAHIIYVRVRDKAGARLGYFYGSDTFFINTNQANGGTSAQTTAARIIHRYSTSAQWGQYVGATTTGYGVYGYSITTAGKINLYSRYNSNYSLTVNGTYHVEVYALSYPDGVNPFDA